MRDCDRIRCEVTTDDMLEMEETEVDSTTEDVATPVKKPKVERKNKKGMSAKEKVKVAQEKAKMIFANMSGN